MDDGNKGVGEVNAVKISLSRVIVRNCASPGFWKQLFGWELVRAFDRFFAAWCALLAGDEDEKAQLCGKNWMVMVARPPLVPGICMRWEQ